MLHCGSSNGYLMNHNALINETLNREVTTYFQLNFLSIKKTTISKENQLKRHTTATFTYHPTAQGSLWGTNASYNGRTVL